MTRAFAVVRVAALAAAVGWLPGDVSAQPAGDNAFKEGLNALRAGRWTAAIDNLRRAIQADPTEATRKVELGGGFLGINRRDAEYLPHYYLGEALSKTGDCLGAIEQWEISEGQGAIRRVPDVLKDLQEGYRDCDRKGFLPPPEYAASRKETRQALDQADAAERTVGGLAQSNRDLMPRETGASLDGARKELAAARAKFASGEKGRRKTDFAEAKSGADRARATLVSIESTLNGLVRDRATSVTQQANEIEKIIIAARETDRSIDVTINPSVQLTAEMQATRQASREHLDTATSQVDGARRAQNPTSLAEARNHANEATRGLSQVLSDVKVLINRAAEIAATAALQLELERAIARAKQAFSFAEASFARLIERLQKRPDRATAEVTTQRDELQKRIIDLRPRLDREGEGKNLTGIQAITRSANSVRTRLDALIESFGPVTVEEQVGTALYKAAQSFIEGDYAGTITTLDSSSAPAGPMQAHAHVFRAASLFALYMRSGEKDQALLNRANGEIGAGRKLDPGLQLDRRVFSPRFITAYESGGIRPPSAPAPAPAR